jgi:predicted O-methyltransferase YrrM
MGKLSKLFKALGMIAKQPSLLNHVIDDDAAWKRRVLKRLARPAGLRRISLTDLADLHQVHVAPYGFLDGGSLPTDLALLAGLAQRTPGCDYLEIGTWRGESVANVAPHCTSCVTIDLPEEELKAMGKDQAYLDMYAHFSRHLSQVQHIRQNTAAFNFGSLQKKFDLIFVDGDHHYEGVKRDTRNVFGLRKNERAVIVWHDYAFSPEQVRWEVLAGILDGIPGAEWKNLYHVSNTLCCIYMQQPPASFEPSANALSPQAFEVTITPLKGS